MFRASTRMMAAGLVALGLASGCSDQQAKQLGENASEGAGKIQGTLRQAAQSLGKTLVKVRQSLDDAELAGKVYARVLWDQQLQEAKVSVDAKPGGIVTMRGKVLSRSDRRRVIELAETTVGVTEVKDELEVDPDLAAKPKTDEEELQPARRERNTRL